MVVVRDTCLVCMKQISSKFNLIRHLKIKHNLYACAICLESFKSDKEMRFHRLNQHKNCMICKQVVFNNYQRHVVRCDKQSYKEFKLEDSKDFKTILMSKLQQCTLPIKWILNRKVKFVKYSTDESGNFVEDAKSEPTFRCLMTLTTNKSELSEQIDKNLNKIIESIDTYQKEGSGWQYVCTDHWLLKVYRYRPLA